jgi:hypothetical protein
MIRIPAPQRKRGGLAASLDDQRRNQQSSHIAPGLKNRGLRATTMNLRRHQQRAGSVSDRSLAASTRRSAPSSAALRQSTPVGGDKQHWLPQGGEGNLQHTISVRLGFLLTIVLQLQSRYRKCVHFKGGAYIGVENVRTTSLRTKGAYISESDVRTRNFEAVANSSQTRRAERHGGRSLQMAISVPRIVVLRRRVASVSRPLRRPSNDRQVGAAEVLRGYDLAARQVALT